MRPTLQFQVLFLMLLTMTLLVFTCCNDEIPCNDETNVECPNYDPCWDVKPVSADFRMGYSMENIGDYFSVIPDVFSDDLFWEIPDSFFSGSIRFQALDTLAESYLWKVGTDNRSWTTREFTLSFGCDLMYQSLQISLITKRLKDSTCIAEGLLTDTITKNIIFIPKGVIKVKGEYNGHFDKYPDDNITIQIISNCPEENCSCFGYSVLIKYKEFPDCNPEYDSGRNSAYRMYWSDDIYFYYPEQGCFAFGRDGFYRMGYQDVFMYNNLAGDSLFLTSKLWFEYPDSTVRPHVSFKGERVY